MVERERPEATSRPGAIAMSWAGVTELVVSAVLFGLKIYAASIAFGVGALFVALIANTISGQARTMQRRQGIEPAPVTDSARRMRHIGFFAASIFGTAAVIAATIQLVGGGYLQAVAFGMWALCCAVFALRFR